MICNAIKEYEPLKGRKIKVIAQGSYRNNTNVRQESDVDICVCCMDPFFDNYTLADYNRAEAGVIDAPYCTYKEFKDDVETALVLKFGKAGVTRGPKAFDVHPNTYRVDADVVAAFAHRQYEPKRYNALLNSYATPYVEPEGTQFYPDGSSDAIVNWPAQHYTNGVAKNKATNMRFKAVVRALKNLKYDMETNGNADQKKAATEAPSYLVECLIYNVPEFVGDSPRAMVRNAVIHAYKQTEFSGGWARVC